MKLEKTDLRELSSRRSPMLESALWIGTIVLQSFLTVVLVVRGMHRRVPWFLSYIAFLSISSLVLFVVHRHSYYLYFYSYWAREAVLGPLELAVVYEVILSVFGPYAAIQRLLRICAAWALIILALVGAFVALNFPPPDTDRVLATVLVAERSLRIVDVGLLLLLFMFAYFLRLSWPHHARGTAVGFALYCAIVLVTFTARTHVGTGWTALFVFVNSASFVLALVLWNITFLTSERPAKTAVPPSQLQEWNRALEGLLAQ